MKDYPAACPTPLPNGATGIECGDFVIEFLRNKVVFLPKSRGEHCTLHFGPTSGVIDFHRTWTADGGSANHETLFAIRHEDLLALLAELTPSATHMSRLVRRLRLGWLHRHGITIVKGLEPTTHAEIAAVTNRHARRKRLVVDEDKVHENIHIPQFLDEVWDFPDGPFALFDHSRRIGIGIKTTDPSGQARLHWVHLRHLRRFFRVFHERLRKLVARHALPPDQYQRYGLYKR